MISSEKNSINSTQLQKSNADAWQYLIRIYYPVLCRYAYRILKDNAAAEDVTTEVMIKLWEKKIEFENETQIKNYMYASIRNACLNLLRTRQREESRNETFANTYLLNDDAVANEVIYAELLAEIRKEIDAFPPRMKVIFIMAYFQQKTNEEIAAELNLSNQTVRNQKASALAHIRKKVKTKFSLRMMSLVLLP